MRKIFIFSILMAVGFAGNAQQAANRPTLVAGFPVNYNEDSVGTYTLPDLLTCLDGQRVTSSKLWVEKRRPEVLRLFEEIQFGKVPAGPKKINFKISENGTPAFNGLAIRKQVTVYLTGDTTDHK